MLSQAVADGFGKSSGKHSMDRRIDQRVSVAATDPTVRCKCTYSCRVFSVQFETNYCITKLNQATATVKQLYVLLFPLFAYLL